MQATESEHITGRRFDISDGSNLVLFRGTDPKIGSGSSRKLHDQDMLDYVRAQEQKLKLEKLKWHENIARVTAQNAKTVVAAPHKPTKAPQPPAKAKKVAEAVSQAKVAAKPRVSPKNVADLIEDRTKRASQWLHQEQREFASKKIEIAEHKRAAKELDQKIRAQQHQDAEKKRQKQLRLLYEDPAVQVTLPVPVAMEAAASAQTLPQRMSVVASAAATSTSTALLAAHDVRVSYDTMVIQQVASQLQLPEHFENELLLAHKRPRVPLLSRSHVNKSNLVHVGANEHVNAVAKPEEAAPAVQLTRRERVVKKADESGSESEGYGDDEDFEQTDAHKAATGPADAALVKKVFRNERYSTPHGRAHSDDESEDESVGEGSHHHHHGHAAAVDEITRQSEELSLKRREDGKEYAARKRQHEHRREEEARRVKALQEEKRKLALAQLKTRVVGINKRTKHTVSGVATGSINSHTPQSTSNITSNTGTPASLPIRAMLSGSPDPSEDATEALEDVERPSIASIKEFVMNKYDFLPRQMLSADDVDSINYNDFAGEYVDSAANSRPQSRLTDAPSEGDLRHLDPREAGGWKQFLEQERRLLRAAQQDAEVCGSTPPRMASSSRPTTAPSSSQSRRRTSPPVARLVSAASQQAAAAMAVSQARRPTPPPFRFNSWQGQVTSGAKRQDERPDNRGMQTRSMGGTGAGTGNFRPAANVPRSASTGRNIPHQEPPKRPVAKKTMNTQPAGHRTTGRKSLPPRSSSAGSQGLSQRRRRSQGAEASIAQSGRRYAQPAQKSRSVLHQGSREDAPGGDTLDLFDRYQGSDDDEPNFYDDPPAYEEYDGYGAPADDVVQVHDHGDAHTASGLGGYLSRSPARGFLPETEQYRSEHDVESFLVVPRTDGIAARSLEEARLMQDVSFQAIKNFEQVTRVLQDVDRWCERAKHDTLELQEKLRLRESTESLADLYPHAANDYIPPLDRSDIDVIRSSLVGRLASAPELIPVSDSDSSGSADQSQSPSQSRSESQNESLDGSEDSRSKYSYELSEEERNNGDSSGDDAGSVGEEPFKPHASWNDRLLPVPVKSSAFDLKTPHKSDETDRFGSEERKNTEESEDTVLMASDSEKEAAHEKYASDYDEASEDEPRLTFLRSSAADPQLQSAPSNLLLLNTDRADRPLIWAPGSSGAAAHSVAEFSAKDPLMTQQLGLIADRNEIFAKFANIRASDLDSPEASTEFPRTGRYSQPQFAAEPAEDWTKPVPRSAPTAAPTHSDSQPSYLPSLRNVGELAGLLRSTYRLDISTETGRAAVLERSSDDDSDSDEDSVIGENYDNFSAVSIFASKMMEQQAAQLAGKEAAMKLSKLPTQTPVGASVASVASEPSRATTKVNPPVSASESDDDKEDSFYSSEAIAQRLARFEDTSLSALDPPDIPTDELLHDYVMTARYGVDGTASEGQGRQYAAVAEEEKADGAKKVRFSGAEMRMRMMDELRRQDELFNYTLELADMEKTNALQGARDLAMQAQQRSEKEFALVKQQQELDMQRLAYENALALSLVNAQAAMDKHAAEQREHVVQLESQIGVQEMFRQYQDLLHQANHVAGSLEHNQKLLQLEKLVHEGHARDVAADLESKNATERASLVLAHAEAQQSQALAMAAASRSSWQAAEASHAQVAQVHAQAQALAQAQMQALAQAQALAQVPRHAGSPGRQSRSRLEESTGAAARYAEDSFEVEEDYEEEYSTQFEAEASMVSKPFSKTGAAGRRDVQAHNESMDSIPEDVSSEPAEQHSLSVSDSVHYSPGNSVRLSRTGLQRSFDRNVRKLHDSTQSIQSASSSSREAAGRMPEDSYAEDEIPEDAMEETGEVTEESESVFESYQDSPIKGTSAAKVAAMSYSRVSTDFGASAGSQSHSQSRSAMEISERSRGASQSHAQSRSHASVEHSGDFEVEDEDAFEQDDASIPEEVNEEEEEEDGYDNYSDTFEASGSKGSKSSSLSNKTPPLRRAQPIASKGLMQTGISRTYAVPALTTIPTVLDSSLDKDAFDEHNVGAVLEEYRSEMEQRLRAQEKTYKLKVQFLRAKQAQRLEWLEKVRQNKKIKASDIEEEEQRIHDTYAEERAEVERERWALNARSYKELRKFKRLRKELVSYQVNMENSAEAAAEFESALLSLKSRGSDMRTSREMQRFGLRESSDSVGSSSDSNVMFGQFKKLGSASGAVGGSSKIAAAQVHSSGQAQKGSVIASSKFESANDDSYADEFETTFSRSNSPVKTTTYNKNASPQPRGGKFTELSYSGVYEDLEASAASAAEEVPSESEEEADEVQDSVASEIPEEQDDASFNDSIEDAPYVSRQDDADYAEQGQDDSRHSSPAREHSHEQEYSHEEFEETGVSASFKSDFAPGHTSGVVASGTAAAAVQEASSSGSYEEDFVDASNESEESKTAEQHSPEKLDLKATTVPQRDEESEASEVIDEIESEDDAQSRHSDASSEEYQLEASHSQRDPAQGEGIEKRGSAEDAEEEGSGEFGHDLQRDTAEDPFQSQEKPADVSHHSHQSFEDSYHSDHASDSDGDAKNEGENEDEHAEEPEAEERVSTSMHSAHSLGSRSASAQEDQDEVNLQDEDDEDSQASDEYGSEFDSEPEDDEREASEASPAKSLTPQPQTPTQAVPQKDERAEESEAEEVESIATEEDEDEDGEGSAVLGQRSGSNSESDDYFKASGIVVSPAVSPLKSESTISPLRSEVSPMKVETKRVAMNPDHPMKISPATSFSPMRSQHSERSASGEYAESDDPEVWGSEDFAESPSAFSRKTSDLMMHQLSSDTAFGPSPTRESSGNNMVYDADQQRWVGGEEVSLDGFDESIGAVENDHDLSSHATPRNNRSDDERPELIRGTSSESRRSHSDSIEEVDESSFSEDEDIPAPLQHIQSHSQDHLPGSHRGIAINAASPWESGAETSASNSPLAGSRLKPFDAHLEAEASAEEPLTDGVAGNEDYGSDFSDEGEPSRAEIEPSASKDKESDAGSEVESDIEEDIASEVEVGEEQESASPQPSPVRAASAVESTVDADAANLTMLSAVSAVEESVAASASDLSALLASTEAAQLDSLQEKYLASEQDTVEGSISDQSFDYMETLDGEEEQPKAEKAVTTKAKVDKVEDFLLDDLDFGSDSDVEGEEEEVEVGLSSEATQEADLSDFRTNYIEGIVHKTSAVATIAASADDSVELPEFEISEELEQFEPEEEELIVIPASPEKEVAVKSDTEKREEEQKKEEEQRLVLVEEVTDHLLDALVQAETRRVLALVPHAAMSKNPVPAHAPAQAKDVSEREYDAKYDKKMDADEEEELSADLDELAETLTLSSARFAPKVHAQAQAHAKNESPEHHPTKDEQESKSSSLPPLTSLTSLGALPSLGAKKYTPVLDTSDEVEEDEDYSLKALVPAEFDDEDVYEFDIPTTKAAPVLSLSQPDDTEESRAGAALAASLVAAEAVQQQCVQITTETKAFVGAVLDEAGPSLVESLGDPLFQGRFVDVPAFLADSADELVIHKGALADRINELCEEIFEAKHASSPSSTQPFSRRLLLQTLPLQSAAVKAHLLAQVLSEQAEHSAVLQSAVPEVAPSIDALDAFRQETSSEIQQSCDQMADAILARVLIETVADLGKFYDLAKLLL